MFTSPKHRRLEHRVDSAVHEVLQLVAHRTDLHTRVDQRSERVVNVNASGVCGLLCLQYDASVLCNWEYTDSDSFFRIYSVNGTVYVSVFDEDVVLSELSK